MAKRGAPHKPGKRRNLFTWIDERLHGKLVGIAREDGMSLSGLVRTILKRWVKRRRSKNGKSKTGGSPAKSEGG